ncbi:MAG: D-glycero-beta-D-manno-heptose 1-phosphate adenylyltransferase [Ignavibacteriae bacterium]|nr:D-glycero-beta-D-manno-heptose 1-phosphate adenylyltransferase [Ignavibacteria bacterium]MBI3364897.1 D-glycero-beta-D-manno-heptose 1-phosphate adenylyltransferase [Ignavibacteriota bacterium]
MGRVVGIGELKDIREKLHREKKTVVFTNGCFDIIHRGHIEYLVKAKALGDVLVVGINTDASVRRIKGSKRPVVCEDDRAYIVANLTPVDYVCAFGEDTPLEIITVLRPDVLVKGADWNIDDIVGKDIVERSGGHVATIDLIPNRSTSSIIEHILEQFSSR